MNRPLNVAMIILEYYPHIGGAQRVLAALCPMLQAHKVNVHVLTRYSPGLSSFERIDGIPVYRIPAPGPKAVASLTFTFIALKVLRQLRPDIIHAHSVFSPATTAVFAKYLFGTPVVTKILRSGPAPLGEIARLRKKFGGKLRLHLFRQAIDRFVVMTNEIDSELDAVGIPAKHRVFIPNGIDTTHFVPLSSLEEKRALRQSMGIPDVPIAVFTGRLSSEKRIHHLLNIWPAVRQAYPDALLLVVGSGSVSSTLQQSAGEGIQFIGRVNNVVPYLQAADLFVLPSVAEGLSVALLEAMAAGLPAVVTNVGGAPDCITHGENGWLIPPDDVAALKKAIITLLADPVRRGNLGKRGRERVIRDYALSVNAGRLYSLYHQLLDNFD